MWAIVANWGIFVEGGNEEIPSNGVNVEDLNWWNIGEQVTVFCMGEDFIKVSFDSANGNIDS